VEDVGVRKELIALRSAMKEYNIIEKKMYRNMFG
jgi:hypothetical protein